MTERLIISSSCLICLEEIKEDDLEWKCESCNKIFHFECIFNWYNDINNEYFRSKNSLKSYLVINMPDVNSEDIYSCKTWYCPNCRVEYSGEAKCNCYCGKHIIEVGNRSNGNSCGEICNKLLKCGIHRCKRICHRNECDICSEIIEIKCCCGKNCKEIICGNEKHEFYCNEICNRTLDCGHKCILKCHPGNCIRCNKTHIIECNCGNERKEVNCNIKSFECDRICNRLIECGNHRCNLKCHKIGECMKCELYEERYCPCGKTKYVHYNCLEKEVPTCDNICNKLLCCNIHYCERKCHYGDCDKCYKVIKKECLCGKTSKEMICSNETFRCNIKCNKLKNCGRHRCNKKCCNIDDESHICELICDKLLNCGKHRCKDKCHSGKCDDCKEKYEICCDCGYTRITIPCIKYNNNSNNNYNIRCIMRCRKPSLCHHKEIQYHLCHKGNCPQCNLPCQLPLKGCNHKCSKTCHDAIIVDPEKSKDLRNYLERDEIKYIKEECELCSVRVKRSCVGNHITKEMKCSDEKYFDCDGICNRLLKCGNHKCQLKCHNINYPDVKTLEKYDHPCEECKLKCMKIRKCKHECKIGKCHSGECPECDIIYSLKCYCGKNDIKLKCCEYIEYINENNESICCCNDICMKKLPCGHFCNDKCHKGKCNGILNCSEEVKVGCKCGKIVEIWKCCDARRKAIPLGVKINKDNLYIILNCEDHERKEEEKLKDNSKKESKNKNILLLVISLVVVIISVVVIYKIH